ncbi:MAG: hypothetical protein ACE360_11265 [Hyphomicrobiales bacterium]
MSELIASGAIWSKLGKIEAGRRRLHQERQQRDEKKRADAREAESDFADLAVPFVQATTAQIEAFTDQLDRYDAATVAALHQNDIELELVRERLEDMLLRAHVLEDGRRVFRTEDGTKVFDEFGAEVAPEIIEPDAIDPSAPTWEEYWADRERLTELTEERENLLDYQERLDEARDQVTDGDITTDELDALSDELGNLMPARVQAELGIKPTQLPTIEADFVRATAPAVDAPNLSLPELNL